jgi:hypothetical protein
MADADQKVSTPTFEPCYLEVVPFKFTHNIVVFFPGTSASDGCKSH